MSVSIVPVRPDRIAVAWDTIEPWLEKAMEHGPRLYDPSDVREACEKKEMILWVAIDAERIIGMAITTLEKYPRMTLMVARWAGGERGKGREWLKAMIDELGKWGREWDAALLTGGGRAGWLSGFGFRQDGVLFSKELSH
jgi:hypothetical protein